MQDVSLGMNHVLWEPQIQPLRAMLGMQTQVIALGLPATFHVEGAQVREDP